MKSHNCRCLFLFAFSFAITTQVAVAEPTREWDWHMPGAVYKELDFTDRAGVDRAVKLFQQAIDAERAGAKPPDLVPRYRAAAGEWRKVQVQSEGGESNEQLIAYAVFMQGYARMQARDRNEAIRLFNEVIDLHGEETFIAVPARYMLSTVKRAMGEVRKADADIEEIIDDKAADGHPIFYNVLRDRGNSFWNKGMVADAIEMWSKIVYSKGKPDRTLWWNSRDSLIVALVTSGGFADLEKAVFAGIPEDKRKERRDALVQNVDWFTSVDTYGHHSVTLWLNAKFPNEKGPKKRQDALDKIARSYAAWLDGQGATFDGLDDGWSFAFAQFRAHALCDKPEASRRRLKDVSKFVSGAKPDQVDGRARSAALACARFRMAEDARAMALLARSQAFKTHLQYEVEYELGAYKAAVMYLEEYCGMQPPPAPDDLRRNQYELANIYRYRVGQNEKAAKLYKEIDDPPRSLWGYSEAMRAAGKKAESYKALAEIVAMFPSDASDAVYRMGEWREADGEKEKAIALYRRILKHPQWKASRAASSAHQALERHGVLTGGAMTNEVR